VQVFAGKAGSIRANASKVVSASRLARLASRQDDFGLVLAVGLATFVFGLLAGALLNLLLLARGDPMVHELRTTLTYRSAIFGDGLLLPVVNMAATSYLARHRRAFGWTLLLLAFVLGAAMTGYFHVMQATNDLVNWSMPMPWHWNGIGLVHALYMFAVVSWLWLFLLVVIRVAERPTALPREAGVVVAGLVLFLWLLRLDYRSADLQLMPPVDLHYPERATSAIAASLEAIGVAPR